jgi:hypothetical protein
MDAVRDRSRMKRIPIMALLWLLLDGLAGAASPTATPSAVATAIPTAFASPQPIVCANAIGCKKVIVADAIPQSTIVKMAVGDTITYGCAATGTGCAVITPLASTTANAPNGNWSGYLFAPADCAANQDPCVSSGKPFNGSFQ